MAHLRFVVLFASTSAILLILAASASPPAPAVYIVGDEMGWAVPPGGATGALNDWASRHRFLVGDILLFRGAADDHDGPALLVPRDGYERCSAARSPSPPFADGGGGGASFTAFKLGRPGPHYFISGAPWHCEAGERMAVFVEDPRASLRSTSGGAPAPAPAPGTTQPPDTPPPPSGHRRLSLAQKEFAAAAIGFGAGFVLIFCFLFICVCFR